MYCPENVSLFGTHVAVTDHRCCGSIGVVTYAAVGTLAEILGSSPTVTQFCARHTKLRKEQRCCDTFRYQQC